MDQPGPEAYAPPLTPWGHTWRVLGMLVVVAAAWGPMAERQLERPAFLALDLSLGVVAFVVD